MTDEEYRKKQRLLIVSFTLGSIIILIIFIFSVTSHFADLQLANPIDEIVDEDDTQELEQIRRSINELNEDFEEFQSTTEQDPNNQVNTDESSSTSETRLDTNGETNIGEEESGDPDINEFLRP